MERESAYEEFEEDLYEQYDESAESEESEPTKENTNIKLSHLSPELLQEIESCKKANIIINNNRRKREEYEKQERIEVIEKYENEFLQYLRTLVNNNNIEFANSDLKYNYYPKGSDRTNADTCVIYLCINKVLNKIDPETNKPKLENVKIECPFKKTENENQKMDDGECTKRYFTFIKKDHVTVFTCKGHGLDRIHVEQHILDKFFDYPSNSNSNSNEVYFNRKYFSESDDDETIWPKDCYKEFKYLNEGVCKNEIGQIIGPRLENDILLKSPLYNEPHRILCSKMYRTKSNELKFCLFYHY